MQRQQDYEAHIRQCQEDQERAEYERQQAMRQLEDIQDRIEALYEEIGNLKEEQNQIQQTL